MNIVSSRFSVLKIEDDDDNGRLQQSCKAKQGSQNTQPKKTNKTTNNKTVKATTKQPSQTNIKDGNAKRKKSKKTKTLDDAQWEQWKQKDDEFVDENFKEQLQQAILNSRLEQEQSKSTKNNKDEANEKTNKKKKNTMSWNDFVVAASAPPPVIVTESASLLSENFFETVEAEMTNEFDKEKMQSIQPKHILRTDCTNYDEKITSAQFHAKLELENKKYCELLEKYKITQGQLIEALHENAHLKSIMKAGEFKSKSQLMEEVERLREVNKSLSDEYQQVYSELQQLKSKIKK